MLLKALFLFQKFYFRGFSFSFYLIHLIEPNCYKKKTMETVKKKIASVSSQSACSVCKIGSSSWSNSGSTKVLPVI